MHHSKARSGGARPACRARHLSDKDTGSLKAGSDSQAYSWGVRREWVTKMTPAKASTRQTIPDNWSGVLFPAACNARTKNTAANATPETMSPMPNQASLDGLLFRVADIVLGSSASMLGIGAGVVPAKLDRRKDGNADQNDGNCDEDSRENRMLEKSG